VSLAPLPLILFLHGPVTNSLNHLGGSAKAAGDLVKQLKGQVIGYLFILEIPGLNGRDKLEGAPTKILMDEA
jgi:hypothetical protein